MFETMFTLLIQRRLPTLDTVLKRLIIDSELTPATVRSLVAVKIKRTVDMWLDIDQSGFTFSDSGPHNLAALDEPDTWRIVFCDWEHSELANRKANGLCTLRRIFNQSFRRVIASASSFMADNPEWSHIARALTHVATQQWWIQIPDSVLSGNDRQWLQAGVNAVAQQLIAIAWPEPPCVPSAARPEEEHAASEGTDLLVEDIPPTDSEADFPSVDN